MHKVAFCGSHFADTKQSDFILHTGGTNSRHPEPGMDDLRKRERLEIIAMGFDDKANRLTVVDVKSALLDQVGIDRRIEPAVIHHVVHMTISIVVHPTCRDLSKNLVAAA